MQKQVFWINNSYFSNHATIQPGTDDLVSTPEGGRAHSGWKALFRKGDVTNRGDFNKECSLSRGENLTKEFGLSKGGVLTKECDLSRGGDVTGGRDLTKEWDLSRGGDVTRGRELIKEWDLSSGGAHTNKAGFHREAGRIEKTGLIK